jgi:putative ABC transport system ATP-binding protein
MVSILGPSGSGKSTLLGCISGLIRPTEGEIHIGEDKLATLSQEQLASWRRNNLGLIFEEDRLFPHLTIKENISLPGLVADVEEDGDFVGELMELMGLQAAGSKFPHELSSGEKQKVAAVRAFAKGPTIVAADEPTGHLDRDSTDTLVSFLRNMADRRSMMILLVTHDFEVAARSDLVALMRGGRISTSLTTPTLDDLLAAWQE